MMDCWNEDPNTRPTFDHLHEITTRFVEDEVMSPALWRIVPTLFTYTVAS